jgi:hypothetical protein
MSDHDRSVGGHPWGTERVPSAQAGDVRERIDEAREHLDKAAKNVREAEEEVREAQRALDETAGEA